MKDRGARHERIVQVSVKAMPIARPNAWTSRSSASAARTPAAIGRRSATRWSVGREAAVAAEDAEPPQEAEERLLDLDAGHRRVGHADFTTRKPYSTSIAENAGLGEEEEEREREEADDLDPVEARRKRDGEGDEQRDGRPKRPEEEGGREDHDPAWRPHAVEVASKVEAYHPRAAMLDLPLPKELPPNEPVLNYAPGSPERAALKASLAKLAKEKPDVPHVIGGKEFRDGAAFDVKAPHDHALVLGTAHDGGTEMAEKAIHASLAAAPAWAATPFEERARIFLRAADLLAGPWRQVLNAATMLGQSKTAYQAEIDAACELIDFLRFNVAFASRLAEQPISPSGVLNTLELRPLEGFVLAVTPFNFSAIAGNLPASCALMGNVVVWKPAENQSFAAYHTMRLFEAAGLPPGVINVVYGNGAPIADACLASRDLAGIHFTGSTTVFQSLWRGVGENIAKYRSYPRIVGETGGKDFVFAHPSAEASALAVALVRGAYEYQGQKCSAASRAYIPRSLWQKTKDLVVDHIKQIKMGDVTDFRSFMGAVINERAWTRLSTWRERLANDPKAKIVIGDGWSREKGWFCGPTLVEVEDGAHPVLAEELFGPLLAVHVYDDARPDGVDRALDLVDQTSPYGLTGAVWGRDRAAIAKAVARLRQAAGNLYINDKPTGAVVGQQPFGGSRASGTNDKAGSAYNLLRWASPRVIKETLVPPTVVPYPSMGES